MPYFFVGVAACRFAVSLYSRPAVRRVLLAVALWGIVLMQIVWFYPGKYASLSMLLYPVTLIPTLFLLLASKWHNRFFCLDRRLCVQYLSFSWFRYFRWADYTENDGD